MNFDAIVAREEEKRIGPLPGTARAYRLRDLLHELEQKYYNRFYRRLWRVVKIANSHFRHIRSPYYLEFWSDTNQKWLSCYPHRLTMEDAMTRMKLAKCHCPDKQFQIRKRFSTIVILDELAITDDTGKNRGENIEAKMASATSQSYSASVGNYGRF